MKRFCLAYDSTYKSNKRFAQKGLDVLRFFYEDKCRNILVDYSSSKKVRK